MTIGRSDQQQVGFNQCLSNNYEKLFFEKKDLGVISFNEILIYLFSGNAEKILLGYFGFLQV